MLLIGGGGGPEGLEGSLAEMSSDRRTSNSLWTALCCRWAAADAGGGVLGRAASGWWLKSMTRSREATPLGRDGIATEMKLRFLRHCSRRRMRGGRVILGLMLVEVVWRSFLTQVEAVANETERMRLKCMRSRPWSGETA